MNNTTEPAVVSGLNSFLPDFFTYHYIMLFLLTSLALIGNTLTIIVITKYDFMRRQQNAQICSLAISDLLSGCQNIVSQAYLVSLAGSCTPMVEFFAVVSISGWLQLVSLSNAIYIGLDKALALTKPLRYSALVTPKVTTALIVLSWVVPAVYVGLTYAWLVGQPPEYCFQGLPAIAVYTTAYLVTVCALTAVLFLLYGRIFYIARIQSRKIGGEMAAKPTSRKIPNGTKMIVVMLTAYVLSYIPFIVLSGVTYLEVQDPLVIVILGFLNMQFILANSGVNIIVYGLFSEEFRRAYRMLLCCCCRPGETRVASTSP